MNRFFKIGSVCCLSNFKVTGLAAHLFQSVEPQLGPDPNQGTFALLGVIGVGLLICALIGRSIGATKGRSGLGFVFGLIFGPLGLIVIAAMSMTVEEEVRREQYKEYLRQQQGRR